MAACCLGMTILVLLGHPSLALIPGNSNAGLYGGDVYYGKNNR